MIKNSDWVNVPLVPLYELVLVNGTKSAFGTVQLSHLVYSVPQK